MIVSFSVPPSRELACIQSPGKLKRDFYSVRITAKTLNGIQEQQVAACLAFWDPSMSALERRPAARS